MEQKRKNVSPFSNEARNVYVVEHITASMLDRLKTQAIEEISISDLCNDAGVGRTSFYRNFESREDIVRKHLRKLFKEWAEDWESSGEESPAKMYGSLFAYLKKYSGLFQLLQKRGLMHLMLEIYLERYGATEEDPNIWAYTKSFIAYGTYGWMVEWLNRGMPESAETMAVLLSSHGMK